MLSFFGRNVGAKFHSAPFGNLLICRSNNFSAAALAEKQPSQCPFHVNVGLKSAPIFNGNEPEKAGIRSFDSIPGEFGEDVLTKANESPFYFWQDARIKYNSDLFKMTFGGLDQVICTDLKLAKQLYTMELHSKSERSLFKLFEKLLGASFMEKTSHNKHKEWRKDWQPFFNASNVSKFSSMIETECIKFLDNFVENCNNNNNDYLEVYDEARDFTFLLALKMWFGDTVINEMEYDLVYDLYTKWGLGFTETDADNDGEGTILNDALKALKELSILLEHYIDRAHELYDNNELDNNTMLYQHLNTDTMRKYWDKNDEKWGKGLGEFIALMIFASHETTATGVNNLLHMLSQKWTSNEMNILRNEINGYDFNNNKIDNIMDDIPYLTYFVKETLRYHPFFITNPRKTLKDIEFGGYQIPKGQSISTAFHFFNFSDKYWYKPFEFNPERWNPDNLDEKALNNQKALMSFGMGNRRCLGMQLAMLDLNIFLAVFMKHSFKVDTYIHEKPVFPFNRKNVYARIQKM